LHRDGVTLAFGDNVLFTYPMTHLAVVLLHAVVFFAKVIFVTWVQIFFRWTLPRFRYDQLMRLGWTKLLPLGIANLLITGVVVLALEGVSPGVQSTLQLVADVTQALVAAGILLGAIAIVVGLLEPTEHKRFLRSTSARFSAARGGTKPEPQQA
jgi:NADH-quinone oxidoreductase subunit H